MSERLTSGDLVGPANALSAALREGVSMEECCRRVLAAHTPDAGAPPVACTECNGSGAVCCGSGFGNECCGCPDPCPKCHPTPPREAGAGTVFCSRKACNSPLPSPRWWNTSTQAYYCAECKDAITRWPENAGIFEDHTPQPEQDDA